LVPQIAYYVFSYVTLIKEGRINAGDKVNFVVPTGNFGNILAGFYAKEIGIPVNKLICASNENKVLFDFFKTGTYDRNREFILTSSPSMDILISSNLERLIYYICGNDSDKCANLMNQLKEKGSYSIDDAMKAKLEPFVGGFSSEADVFARIKELYENDSYVIDTHTAVASSVYKAYKAETNDETPSLIISTASPYKFPRAVLKAIEGEDRSDDDFALIDILNNVSHVAVPKAVTEVINSPVRFDIVCDTDKMRDEVLQFL
jgi:threonine synthase